MESTMLQWCSFFYVADHLVVLSFALFVLVFGIFGLIEALRDSKKKRDDS